MANLSKWSEIESDPEFKMLPTVVQNNLRQEYLRQAGGPAKSLPAPKPKGEPLAPYLPKVSAPKPAARKAEPPKTDFGALAREQYGEGFGTNLTGTYATQAETNIKATAPDKPFIKGAPVPAGTFRQPPIDYSKTQPAKPLTAQLSAAVQGAADTVEGARQNLTSGNAGLAEGLVAATASTAGQLSDPLGLLVDAATLKQGGNLVKAALPKLGKAAPLVEKASRPALAFGSGAAQGVAQDLADGKADDLVTNALTSGALSMATSGKAIQQVDRLKTALSQAKSPRAKAKLEARIATLEARVAEKTGTPDTSAVARLVGDEAGEFRPSPVVDSLAEQLAKLRKNKTPEGVAKRRELAEQVARLMKDETGEFRPQELLGTLKGKPAWEMTLKEYLGDSKKAKASNAADLKVRPGRSTEGATPEPFMGGRFQILRGEDGQYAPGTYLVMDGDKPVATYDGNNLVVDKAYRRQGVATALVAEFRARKPEVPAADSRTPNAIKTQKASHRVIIEAAINDGLTVPPAVLADYPDLARIARAQQNARLQAAEPPRATPDAPSAGGSALEGRTFRDFIADESGEFDLSAFLSGVKRQVGEATKASEQMRAEGRVAEANDLQARANDLRDVRTLVDQRPATPANAQAIDATKYFNPSKYNFASNESILKFDALTREAVAERGMDPKQVIPFNEIRRRAAEMTSERLDDLSAKPLKFGQSLTAVEYEAAKNTLQTLIEESTALEQRINTLPASTAPEVRNQMTAQLQQLEKDAKGFMDVIIPSRSQKGRDLAYLKMVAQNGFSADYWLARAHRVSGGALPPNQMSTIREILVRGKTAETAGDAAGVRQAKVDLAKAMGRLEQTGALEALSALRKAGLLTGVKTIGRNMGGTWLYQALEETVKVPAWGIDSLMAMATNQRTVALPSARKIGAGLSEARTRGVREFGEVMMHGLPLEQLANLEITREINTGFAPLDVYANTVFRFQSAQDRLAKAYAMERSILDQAELKAVNERRAGQHGPDPRVMARHYAANPTDEMVLEAIADADFMTFTNDTPLSKAITQGTQALTPRLKFAFDIVMPFKKTPLAVADRILQYAVIGQMGEVMTPGSYARLAREGLNPQQQKAIALGASRGLVGSSVIMMGYWLAQAGLMTGTYEPDKAAVNQAAGRTPSSLKVNGQWVPVQPLSPIGNLLTLGATVQRMQAAGLNAAEAPGAVGALTAKTVLDQPMTQGAMQVVDLARDPDKSLPKFGASLAGSMVPTLFNEIGQSVDTVDREVSKTWPDSGREAIQKKMFGHRLDLPAKRTPLGDTIPVPNGPNAFNPFAGRQVLEDTDPVVRTLVEFNPRFPKVPDVLKDRGDQLPMDREMKDEFQQRAGMNARLNIRELLRDPEFTEETDREVKQKLIEDALGDARQRAKEAMMDLYEDRVVVPE